MKKAIDLLMLDENYQIVALINYTLLQWTRKYYQSGTFSIEIPLEQYDSRFKYVYTKDRPELGLISQTNYIVKDGFNSVNLSGYFLENELNRRIAYAGATVTNVKNAPAWSMKSGKAEDVATDFFNAFKDVKIDSYTAVLGITAEQSKHRGKTAEHTRQNEKLGSKIYSILKPSKMSYRVSYDFDTNDKVFKCWSGVDRSTGNQENNNPVIFSTRYGNIKNADLLVSTTDYKNGYIVTKSGEDTSFTIAGSERKGDEIDSFVYVSSSSNDKDYSTQESFINALKSEGHDKVLANDVKISFDFDVIEGSYEYLEDFDLGDICSIEIYELDFSVDAVLSGIYEVVKKGVPTISLEFTV